MVEMVVATKVSCNFAAVAVAAAVAVRCNFAAEAVAAAVAVRCTVAVAAAAVVVVVRCIVAFAVARCVVALGYTHTGFAGMKAETIAGFSGVSAPLIVAVPCQIHAKGPLPLAASVAAASAVVASVAVA